MAPQGLFEACAVREHHIQRLSVQSGVRTCQEACKSVSERPAEGGPSPLGPQVAPRAQGDVQRTVVAVLYEALKTAAEAVAKHELERARREKEVRRDPRRVIAP